MDHLKEVEFVPLAEEMTMQETLSEEYVEPNEDSKEGIKREEIEITPAASFVTSENQLGLKIGKVVSLNDQMME